MPDVKLIANRYQIQTTIGEFFYSTLYRAWDTASKQGVMLALGNLEAPEYDDPQYQVNERKFMGLLHPHLARLIHFGVHENRRYLVMPVLAGQPLAAYLSDKPESLENVQRWAASLGSALVYLHNEGVLYRQLSPENIWLDDQYNALLLPIPTHIPPKPTVVLGHIPFDVRYLPPEQLRGETASTASDQYALAVIMYQIITGELQHLYENPMNYMMSVMTGIPQEAKELRADLPQAMNDALMKALSKQAQNRHPSLTDFIDALLPDNIFDPSITDTGTFIQVDEDRFGTQGTRTITEEELAEEYEKRRKDDAKPVVATDPKIDDVLEETEEEGAETERGTYVEFGDIEDDEALDEALDEQGWIDKIRDAIDDATEILFGGIKGGKKPEAPAETTKREEPDTEPEPALDDDETEPEEPKPPLSETKKKEAERESDGGDEPAAPELETASPEPDQPPQTSPPPAPAGIPPAGIPPVPQAEIEQLQGRRSELLAQLLVKRLMRDQSPGQELNEEISHIEAELADINQQIPANSQQTPQTLKTAQAQFTAYYARESIAGAQYGLYVYAHVPDALRQVSADVEKFAQQLGGTIPRPKVAEQAPQLKLGINLSVALEIEGLDFEPVAITKKWNMPFTRFDFAYTAPESRVHDIISGRISIQVSGLEIANIPFATYIEAAQDTPPPLADTMPENPLAAAKFSVSDTVQIYKKIFVSYSRKDSRITDNYRLAQIAVGHDVFMDSYSIRAGENWQAALAAAIDESDIFQLFWSEHSATSKNVRDEWDYALNYRCFNDQCVSFIRPVYWESPLIDPPQELAHLNFRFVPFPQN